jgi:hypothetical protein
MDLRAASEWRRGRGEVEEGCEVNNPGNGSRPKSGTLVEIEPGNPAPTPFHVNVWIGGSIVATSAFATLIEAKNYADDLDAYLKRKKSHRHDVHRRERWPFNS